MTPASPIISAKGLTRTYHFGDSGVIGLDRADFEVAAGAFVVVKGVSGSGKSTLLSLLAGLDRPSGGELQVAGRRLERCSEAELTRYRREVVGMVFQSFNLLPTLSVLENVCLPGLLAGNSKNEAAARALPLLEWLGMSPRLAHRPYQLSGGEMQRTAIARALINDPAIVLADEPTGNLDSRNGRAVIALLTELNRAEGKTILVATHSDQADPHATRTFYLADGILSTET
jgi:putative ABC transport system ATP-binding protein